MFNTVLNDLRTNPRLRLWLALVVGVLGLYGILLLREELQSAQQQQRSTALAISRLQAELTQTEWPERLPPAKTLAVQMEARLWQANTAGLAQAALQDWLNATLAQAKAIKPQVSVTVVDELVDTAGGPVAAVVTSPVAAAADGLPTTPPDLWKIKAKVGFGFSAPTLLDFLSRIENHDQQLIVSALTVRKEPIPQVELELTAYFQKQAGADKAPALVLPPTVKP